MTDFKTSKKVYVKSKNNLAKIYSNYLVTLIDFVLFLLGYNIFNKKLDVIFNILKVTIIFSLTSILINYIISKIQKKQYLKEDLINSINLALVISLFSYDTNILVGMIGLLISLIIKNIVKNINLSSSLYGILLIVIYKCYQNQIIFPLTSLKKLNYIGSFNQLIKDSGGIFKYLLGNNYLSPLLAILGYFYLFHKKSIKYNLFNSYILTFSGIMLLFGLFKGLNVYYLFFQLATGNILFLSIYCLTDSIMTPTTGKGQIIYGMILGLISSILRFIIPEISIIVTIILGELLLSKPIERLSIGVEYNNKKFRNVIILLMILIIFTIVTLCLVK